MKLVSILKWSGTATLIIGTAVNSLGYYPEGPLLLALGGTFWVIVSVMWKEPALIVTNTVLLLVGLAGLSINYLI
jgi:hypothetical protein|tara:strand:- start:246 stop:470 length:225 start_codon:yes stop_codon:yes gene_type:complete